MASSSLALLLGHPFSNGIALNNVFWTEGARRLVGRPQEHIEMEKDGVPLDPQAQLNERKGWPFECVCQWPAHFGPAFEWEEPWAATPLSLSLSND